MNLKRIEGKIKVSLRLTLHWNKIKNEPTQYLSESAKKVLVYDEYSRLNGEVKHSCAAPKCVDIAFKAFDGKLLDNGSSRHLSGHIDIVTQKDGEENETWRDHLHKQSLCTPSPRNHIDLCKFSALVEVVLGLWKI